MGREQLVASLSYTRASMIQSKQSEVLSYAHSLLNRVGIPGNKMCRSLFHWVEEEGTRCRSSAMQALQTLGSLYMARLTGAHAIRASHGSEAHLQVSGHFPREYPQGSHHTNGCLCYECQDKESQQAHTFPWRPPDRVCREKRLTLIS